jgi:hypothetical protein
VYAADRHSNPKLDSILSTGVYGGNTYILSQAKPVTSWIRITAVLIPAALIVAILFCNRERNLTAPQGDPQTTYRIANAVANAKPPEMAVRLDLRENLFAYI